MSWFVTGATIAVGVYGVDSANKNAKSANKAANRAASRADALEGKQLEFEQQRYDDWKGIFGDVQEQLSNYYANLNPDYMTAEALQAFTIEKDRALDEVRTTLEQRGISTSGVAAEAEIDFAKYGAETRAKIRADAPKRVAQEKLGFLQLGLQTDPSDSLSSALSGQASRAGNLALSAAGGAAEAEAGKSTSRATLINTLGEAGEAWRNKPKNTVEPGTGEIE